MAVKYTSKPVLNFTIDSPPVIEQGAGQELLYGAGDMFRSNGPTGVVQMDKQMILDLSRVAVEELMRMAQIGEPLWLPSSDNISSFVLNEEEYSRAFPSGFGLSTAAEKTEASREMAVVMMSPRNLAELLMDVVSLLHIEKILHI